MGLIVSALAAGLLLGYRLRPLLDRGFVEETELRTAERMARLRILIHEQERPTADDLAVMHRIKEGISRSPKVKGVQKPIRERA